MSVLFSIESGFGLMALGCDTPPRKRQLRCTVLPPSPKCPREAETESLKSRLQQTKIASQSLTQAFKILASEIEKTERNIQTAEDGLSELSLQTNLRCRPYPPRAPREANHIQSQIRAIDAAARNLPTPAELQAECARLDIALRAVGPDPVVDREIVRLCTALEDPETSKDVLATVLAAKTEHRVQRPSLDVAAELEAVWARDQADLLDARGAVLDERSQKPSCHLSLLCTTTSPQGNAHMGEAQALIGALREEIQDIVEDVCVAQKPQEKPSVPSPEESKDMELQAGLTSLLKQLKDARPRDASPLVLLSPEDILSELRDVYQREEVSRGQEEEWVANLLPTLRNLETAHAPLLDAVYAYSPLNSSAPFSVPAHVQTVHANAKSKADDLGDAISKLQEDVKTLTNDRAKRRMEQFVSKWAK
ncbi:hypothetical protein B0H14DRAFT_3703843 [Mycena olivaceomarginata]|nr:hypothetical protein B0H14DRAFT_3703843 [Mycena olivaceomarginata]